MGCHHQVELEWMREVFFCAKWLNARWQNLKMAIIIKLTENEGHLSLIELVWVRVLCKMAESKMTEFKMAELGERMACHHQVESEWMSEVFCANGESGREMWVSFFCANGGNSWHVSEYGGKTKMSQSRMAEIKMTAIIKLSENEVFERISLSESFVQNGWIQDGKIQDSCHH